MKCQEKECNETEIVHCWVQDPENGSWWHYAYCHKHCYIHGFCYLCGHFFGGIESFDFNNPSSLCEMCFDCLESELGHYDDEINEFDYEYDYFGEVYA